MPRKLFGKCIESHGTQAAFPTSTIHMPEGLPVQPAGNAEERLPHSQTR